MKKRLALLASFFLVTPAFIFLLVFYQTSLNKPKNVDQVVVLGVSDVEASFEDAINLPEETIVYIYERDDRIELLKDFFAKYNSPLVAHAADIVAAADKYDLDYRLLPAIAMQESTLCLKAPKGLNNCWGFGIYGAKKTAFDNYETAIEIVSKTLSEKYHAKGLIEPADIMTKYTPSNDGEWADNVSFVMNSISSSL